MEPVITVLRFLKQFPQEHLLNRSCNWSSVYFLLQIYLILEVLGLNLDSIALRSLLELGYQDAPHIHRLVMEQDSITNGKLQAVVQMEVKQTQVY